MEMMVTLDLPEEIVSLLGPPEAVAARAKDLLILDLLREGQISQGLAAHLLGLSRWDLLDLMAEQQIASGPESGEEMRTEVEAVRRYLTAHTRGVPVSDRD
ncbi:MAG: UPF0175 family protein [Dehalococcoidia bacterium]